MAGARRPRLLARRAFRALAWLAGRRSVLRLILRQEAIPVMVGLAAGPAGSIAVGRAMRGLPFGVAPNDLITFIATPVALSTIVLVACIVPARRALDVEPVTALRTE